MAEESHIGDYRIIRALSTSATSYLCVDSSGRQVVLKQLESDCLLRGRLHPSIRDRLLRVRELAMKEVATLHSVERINGSDAWLVWDFVDGRTLEDLLADPEFSAHRRAQLARDVLRCVEALHARGIVHGAIHGQNIVVDANDQIHLTHISPLLYTDPAVDRAAVLELTKSNYASDISAAESVAESIESEDAGERRVRRRALLGALAAAVGGTCISVLTYQFVARHSSQQPPPKLGRLDDNVVRR
jgi:serine/threonine protein kinase